jgi:hypothetical protein
MSAVLDALRADRERMAAVRAAKAQIPKLYGTPRIVAISYAEQLPISDQLNDDPRFAKQTRGAQKMLEAVPRWLACDRHGFFAVPIKVWAQRVGLDESYARKLLQQLVRDGLLNRSAVYRDGQEREHLYRLTSVPNPHNALPRGVSRTRPNPTRPTPRKPARDAGSRALPPTHFSRREVLKRLDPGERVGLGAPTGSVLVEDIENERSHSECSTRPLLERSQRSELEPCESVPFAPVPRSEAEAEAIVQRWLEELDELSAEEEHERPVAVLVERVGRPYVSLLDAPRSLAGCTPDTPPPAAASWPSAAAKRPVVEERLRAAVRRVRPKRTAGEYAASFCCPLHDDSDPSARLELDAEGTVGAMCGSCASGKGETFFRRFWEDELGLPMWLAFGRPLERSR